MNATYIEQTIQTIDMDEIGAFAVVASERGDRSYKVRIDESGKVPFASTCSCPSHSYHPSAICKHMGLVNEFYARVYNRTSVPAWILTAQPAKRMQYGEENPRRRGWRKVA